MQYTIEARELTNAHSHRPSLDPEPRRLTVEASDDQAALSVFVDQERSELVSFSRPGGGQEAIATVRKAGSVFLVRIYAA